MSQTRRSGSRGNNASRQNITLGQAVDRQNVPQDLQGKYMGSGTYANANRQLFNTKETVLLGPQWSDLLNETLQQTISQGQNTQDPEFSAGIYGVLPQTGQMGFYVRGITQYYPDDRARISVPTVQAQGVPRILLPGSTAARQANAQGIAGGLAYVKNPMNQTGYLRVGSKGYQDAISRFVNKEFVGSVSEADMQHLIGQGAVYGLGPIYNMYGIEVVPLVQGGEYPVRYRLAGNASVASIASNAPLMRTIQGFYNAYLKNPDQVRLGQYGAASLLLRHADKMTTGNTGDQGDINAVNQAVQQAWAQNGSVAGVARWGSQNGVNYADFNNRRGLTAFPMRDAQGAPVAPGQAVDKRTGDCNIYGSGPGISQRATDQGQYGFRFYKQSRNHLSKRKGHQGEQNGNATYYCGPTPDNVVNPDRKIYQPGGARGGQDGLQAVLDQYGDPNYSAQDLTQRYADWTANPEKYGTNPFFMLDGSNGRGFAKYAPNQYASRMNPQQAQTFNNINLTQHQKQLRSDQLAQSIQNGTAFPTYGKTNGF